MDILEHFKLIFKIEGNNKKPKGSVRLEPVGIC